MGKSKKWGKKKRSSKKVKAKQESKLETVNGNEMRLLTELENGIGTKAENEPRLETELENGINNKYETDSESETGSETELCSETGPEFKLNTGTKFDGETEAGYDTELNTLNEVSSQTQVATITDVKIEAPLDTETHTEIGDEVDVQEVGTQTEIVSEIKDHIETYLYTEPGIQTDTKTENIDLRDIGTQTEKRLYNNFTYDLIEYVLHVVYNDTSIIEKNSTSLLTLRQLDSPFCIHIGEAILAVAKVNRLNFKLRFEEKRDFIFERLENLEDFVGDFVWEIYKKGYFEEFLIIYAFMVDLFVYQISFSEAYNFSYGWFEGVINCYDRVFWFCMKLQFTNMGGWPELKKNIRPWWIAFRRMLNKVNFIDYSELFSTFYTKELLSKYSLDIISSAGHYKCAHFQSPQMIAREICLSELETSPAKDCQLYCLKVENLPLTLEEGVPLIPSDCEEESASANAA